MKYLKVIAFFALGIVSVLYVHYFRECIPATLQSFWDGLVSTFVSTLLSILVGIYLYEYQARQTEKSERERLKSIISAESKDAISILKSNDTMNIVLPSGVSKAVLITVLSPIAHEEAGKSGLFNAQVTENLFHVARKIKIYNMKTDHLLGSLRANNNAQFVEHAINNVIETQQSVIGSCELIISQIENT
ncbi:MAG: hypothetical protein EOO52_07055 [Gammaproteobacteria bacterium]|nr:MAG: hypothetical protein EOO52_07055 [Gammaproteobacteria bacterium]